MKKGDFFKLWLISRGIKYDFKFYVKSYRSKHMQCFLKYCKSMQEEHTRYLWMKELYSQCCIIILQYCQHMVNILKTWCMLNICCLYVWISHTLNICLKHMFFICFRHMFKLCLWTHMFNIWKTYVNHMTLQLYVQHVLQF